MDRAIVLAVFDPAAVMNGLVPPPGIIRESVEDPELPSPKTVTPVRPGLGCVPPFPVSGEQGKFRRRISEKMAKLVRREFHGGLVLCGSFGGEDHVQSPVLVFTGEAECASRAAHSDRLYHSSSR